MLTRILLGAGVISLMAVIANAQDAPSASVSDPPGPVPPGPRGHRPRRHGVQLVCPKR